MWPAVTAAESDRREGRHWVREWESSKLWLLGGERALRHAAPSLASSVWGRTLRGWPGPWWPPASLSVLAPPPATDWASWPRVPASGDGQGEAAGLVWCSPRLEVRPSTRLRMRVEVRLLEARLATQPGRLLLTPPPGHGMAPAQHTLQSEVSEVRRGGEGGHLGRGRSVLWDWWESDQRQRRGHWGRGQERDSQQQRTGHCRQQGIRDKPYQSPAMIVNYYPILCDRRRAENIVLWEYDIKWWKSTKKTLIGKVLTRLISLAETQQFKWQNNILWNIELL